MQYSIRYNTEADIYCNTVSGSEILQNIEWSLYYTNELAGPEIVSYHHISDRHYIDLYADHSTSEELSLTTQSDQKGL